MPGFTTHYIMGMKAYNDMPSNQLKHIIAKHRWLYQLGLQGPDMFFYNLPILRHRDYRNVGSYMHEQHLQDFFAVYSEEMGNLSSRLHREQALAYFCGYVCHYICDSVCHPFIYGRIQYDTGKPGLKHHRLHAELESKIDSLLLMKYKKKGPAQFNQAATICLNSQEIQLMSRLLSKCINEAYYPITYENNFQVTPRMIHRSILALRFGCRAIPSISRKILPHVDHPREVLNLDHQTWVNPWNRKMASDASFMELFNQALSKCSTVFYLINQAVAAESGDFSAAIEELGNYSCHSGLPAEDDR